MIENLYSKNNKSKHILKVSKILKSVKDKTSLERDWVCKINYVVVGNVIFDKKRDICTRLIENIRATKYLYTEQSSVNSNSD